MVAMQIPNQSATDLAAFMRNGRAAAAFVAAALDNDVWERARLNPDRYFEARGAPVPRTLVARLVNGDIGEPGCGPATGATVIRCWWVMVRDDPSDDEDRPKPVRVSLEVPAEVVAAGR